VPSLRRVRLEVIFPSAQLHDQWEMPKTHGEFCPLLVQTCMLLLQSANWKSGRPHCIAEGLAARIMAVFALVAAMGPPPLPDFPQHQSIEAASQRLPPQTTPLRHLRGSPCAVLPRRQWVSPTGLSDSMLNWIVRLESPIPTFVPQSDGLSQRTWAEQPGFVQPLFR
jgi:hypothetical protein